MAPKRRPVKFAEDKFYELLHHNELGVVVAKDIQQRWADVSAMLAEGAGTDITADEAQELVAATDQIVKILVPDAPAKEIHALTDHQKFAIIEGFYSSFPKANRAARRTGAKKQTPTSAS